MNSPAGRIPVVVNIVAYYVGWLACVLGAARGQWVQGAVVGLVLVAAHLALCGDRRGEARLVLAVALVGYAVDSVQTALGLLIFDSGQPHAWLAPLWIGVMWMLFATTLRHAFAWLAGRPLLAAAFGAAGGPAAFWAGAELGAVAFHPLPGLSLAVLAGVWALLFPLLMRLAQQGDRSG